MECDEKLDWEEWFSEKPLCVFLDTSALRRMNFNFSHPSFTTIQEAAECGDVEIVFTDILKGEFLKHSAELIKEAKQKMHGMGVIRSLYEKEINQLLERVNAISNTQLWQKFVSDFKAKEINSPVRWETVFSDYFDSKPPFSSVKTKEFADAFNMKMLDNHNPSFLVVVSPDSDYQAWASSRSNIRVINDIHQLANAYLRVSRPSRLGAIALKAFDFHEEEIIDELVKQYADGCNFELICSRSEIENVEIKQLEVKEIALSAINPDEEVATLNVRLQGDADLHLICPVVAWDSVDKEEISLGTNAKTGTVSLEITATVLILLNGDDPQDSNAIIEDSKLFAEVFEVPDDWTTFLDDDGYEE